MHSGVVSSGLGCHLARWLALRSCLMQAPVHARRSMWVWSCSQGILGKGLVFNSVGFVMQHSGQHQQMINYCSYCRLYYTKCNALPSLLGSTFTTCTFLRHVATSRDWCSTCTACTLFQAQCTRTFHTSVFSLDSNAWRWPHHLLASQSKLFTRQITSPQGTPKSTHITSLSLRRPGRTTQLVPPQFPQGLVSLCHSALSAQSPTLSPDLAHTAVPRHWPAGRQLECDLLRQLQQAPRRAAQQRLAEPKLVSILLYQH